VGGPGDGQLLLRVHRLALFGHHGGGDLVCGQVFAGLEREDIEAARDLSAVDAAFIPVDGPVAGLASSVAIDRATVEIGDLAHIGRVREVADRDPALVPGLHKDIAAGNGNQRAVVRDAILQVGLGGRQLVVTAEHQLAIDDIIDGIGTPGLRVLDAAPRPAASAPFVGEDHLGAVVVERRGVPVGEAFIDNGVDPFWRARVGDVEQDAVA